MARMHGFALMHGWALLDGLARENGFDLAGASVQEPGMVPLTLPHRLILVRHGETDWNREGGIL